MATLITKNSSTASSVPTAAQLVQGELAVNVTDKRLFTENSSGTVVELGTNPSTLALPNGTANGVAYLNGSKVLTTGSALTFDGSIFNLNAGTNARFYRGDNARFGFVFTDNNGLNIGATSTSGEELRFSSTGPQIFFTGSTPTEQMRLTSTGLGIGTSSPAALLDANSGGVTSYASPAANFLRNHGGQSYSNLNGLQIYWNTSNGSGESEIVYGSLSTSYLRFIQNNAGTFTERMRISADGNLGLGVTPSAWNSDYRTMQFGATGLLYGRSGGEVAFGTNWYRDSGGTFRYLTTAAATYQAQASGIHYWFTAPSGTAGNAITFTQAMTLTAGGDLAIGNTSAQTRLTVYTGSEYAANFNTSVTTSATTGISIGSYASGAAGAGGSVVIRAHHNHAGNAQSSMSFMTHDGFNLIERARITSGGDLLVGTTSVTTGVSGTETTLCLKGNSSNKAASFVAVNASGTGSSVFGTGDSTVACYAGTITNHPLVLQTNNTERARIDSSGNLLVGTTTTGNFFGSTTSGIQLSPNAVGISSNGNQALYLNRFTSTGTLADLRYSGSTVGTITVTASATAYNTSSDYRLKENIQPMTGALAKVAALKPCTYKWKADGSDGEGFIAHELAEVCPQAVTGEKDAVDADGNPVYQGIDTSFLVATLTAAIQELKAEFDAYKATHP